MRLFTRYIWHEVLSHALLGGALFTFILFMKYLGQLLEMAARNSASLGSVAKIFLFMLPNTLSLTIPMAVLVGVLLGLSRLAADSEVTAMRAVGIGVWFFVRVVSVVAIVGWGISLADSLYIAPKATAALLKIESSLKDQQASFEIEPRVFYEDFKNYVLYVQDIRAGTGASRWQRIFLADLSDPVAPKVTTAEEAVVVDSGAHTILMRLRNGTEHEIVSNNGAPQYQVSTFVESELPLTIGTQEDAHIGRNDTPILAMSNRVLYEHTKGPGGKTYLIELHKRFAYPAACLVLMLIGIPLGLSSRRGGKSAGFVVTIALVFIYYFLSLIGNSLAREGKVPVFAGVWAANILFAFFGLLLLRQMAVGGGALGTHFAAIVSRFKSTQLLTPRSERSTEDRATHERGRFPLILDDYVLREFLTTFLLVLASFVLLMLVFTFFELLGDIIRNRTPLVTVGEYLINLTPSMVYNIAPLGVLVAVLVTFGVLTRTNEFTAMKATGISLYRVMVPILVVSAVIAVALFLFDESYLPGANRRQEALRSVIKNRPAQTFLRPDQKWIFGRQEPGKPGRIFYYQFFDPDEDRFANLTVFEFNPENFSLSRRIFASSVHWEPQLQQWVFEHGWERRFDGEAVSSFSQFSVETYPEINERPQYFKKEALQSKEMTFGELQRYIRDLRQSGFETKPLSIQLNIKLAYPLITLVMAVLAIPFALTMGKRGSLTGIATAIGLAIAFWVVNLTFQQLGNVNFLPTLLAAWSPDMLFALAGAYMLLRTPT
ncbi:MAG TPA: LptF/LptG family permease [Acidobacteriaceae bacterium]|nr:LptF/LptG family permease [Acidobacteriaceae bacterium]